jgi:hypothetical protein
MSGLEKVILATMKMADGSTILRRNRPGTKAKVILRYRTFYTMIKASLI